MTNAAYKRRLLAVVLPWWLLLSSAAAGAAVEPAGEMLQIFFPCSSPLASAGKPEAGEIPSVLFPKPSDTASGATRMKCCRGQYNGVYPGMDSAIFGDDTVLEYVFSLRQGADPAAIRLAVRGVLNVSLGPTGQILMRLSKGEATLERPVVSLRSGDSKIDALGSYRLTAEREIAVVLPPEVAREWASSLGMSFCVVPAGGQPGGPEYEFYAAKFETTNDDLLRFFNNAEANGKNELGANLFFDARGNVWFNPEMKKGEHEVFAIALSGLKYNPDAPVGRRYEHVADETGKAIFARHPACGVSWYGAVKYCNWMTIMSGRGASERCYVEGTNSADWAPSAAMNWGMGRFDDAERAEWRKKRGFRLAMVNLPGGVMTTNRFNEFYKAAAWNGGTNTVFGYGADTNGGTEANFSYSGAVPVGLFDGENTWRNRRTRRNFNAHGVCDLSGNAAEWLNDRPVKGGPDARYCGGGSFRNDAVAITKWFGTPAWSADAATGFRVFTTHMPEQSMTVHLVFGFYLESSAAVLSTGAVERAVVPAEEPGEPREGREGEEGLTLDLAVTPSTEDGLTYREGLLPELPPPPPVRTNYYVLSVASENPASGVGIEATPPDENGHGGGNTGFALKYREGARVTLVAPEKAGGNSFAGWKGSDGTFSAGNRTVTVVMTRDLTMTAVYREEAPERRNTLTVESVNPNSNVSIDVTQDANGEGSGVTAFTRSYVPGAVVTLTAPAASGGGPFNRWLRDGIVVGTNLTVTITMNADVVMTAVFAPRTLRVLSSGPSSGVGITAAPADILGAGAGSTPFVRVYDDGVTVTLTAPATAGLNAFSKWRLDGSDYGTNLSSTVLMNADHTIMAVFVYVPGPVPDPDPSPSGM